MLYLKLLDKFIRFNLKKILKFHLENFLIKKKGDKFVTSMKGYETLISMVNNSDNAKVSVCRIGRRPIRRFLKIKTRLLTVPGARLLTT